jgi:hypothetical protein
MSRSRWTPFLFAVLAGAAAWAAWRFLPRDWLRLCCGGAPGRPRPAGGPGSAPARVEDPPHPPRPAAAPAGTAAARVVEPQGGETLDEEAPEAIAAAEPARCAAVTQSGNRCSRETEPGSAYCWQHAEG